MDILDKLSFLEEAVTENKLKVHVREIKKLISQQLSSQPHNYLSPKVVMRESKISWKWVFCKDIIQKWELVAIFWGNVMSIEQWTDVEKEARETCMMIHPNFLIWPNKNSEIDNGDYVNHSCDPNTWIKGQICLYSLKEILPWEEITFDYWTVVTLPNEETWEMECKCEKSNCRKVITSHDWKKLKNIPLLKWFFSSHIQELINKKL